MKLSKCTTLLLAALLAACGGGGGGGNGAGSAGSDVDSQSAGALPAISWYNTGKPLLDRYCVACHSEGGEAPFSLETYQQVEGKRSALVYVLEADTMPPAGYADLDEQERNLLLQWLEAGAPKGDPSQSPLLSTRGYTYHGDTRPIIETYCANCHVEGGLAPFPLQNYQQVKQVAAAAAFAVESGSMPPWPPTEGYRRVQHPRVLPAQDEYILLQWLQGDLAEGDPADYVPPEGQHPGSELEYNVRLKLPQPYTPTLRPDDHRCFAIEWPLDEFTYVTGVDVIPDQVAEVHHVIVSIVEPEGVAEYYAAGGEDGRPGWYCLGAGGIRGATLPRQIGGWVPGGGFQPAIEGTGIGVRPGSVMVVQMHYNTLVAEPTPDQSTVLISTQDEVERPASNFLIANPNWLSPGGMPIPAGDPDVVHEMVFPGAALAGIFGEQAGIRGRDPWVLHEGFIHMHTLGKTGRITLRRENGTEEILLDIRDWDFNWQDTYRFEQEVLINPRDRIVLRCSFDNTQGNQEFVNGVQQKARYVEWGDGTGDEMCLMSVRMTRPLEGYDYSYHPTLHIESPEYRQQFHPGDLIPLRLILNNFSLADPGQHEHSDTGHGAEMNDHGQVYSGHYHVYLDTDDDEAEHLTAWDDNYYYELPDDIEPGLHTLRVNLRGHDHHALGIEQAVEFEVVEGSGAERISLIEVSDWTEQGADTDSLADHRPADADCPANSWYEEAGALEVETGYCNYLSLTQPAKVAVRSGDTLHLVLWHGNLAFEEPATAHVAVSIGGNVVWQAEVDIPARAEIFDLRVPVEFDAPAGTPVEYHLHNHGYNTWTLLQLGIER